MAEENTPQLVAWDVLFHKDVLHAVLDVFSQVSKVLEPP